jgi:hypothetical protein
MELFVKTEFLDVMITFKRYCKGAEAIPFVFDKADPRIDWEDSDYFYIYGNYSIMEIQSPDGGWTTALIRERLFKLSLNYKKMCSSSTPVMCFLNREDAKMAEKEYVLIDRATYRLLNKQGLIRVKDLPRTFQVYVYD